MIDLRKIDCNVAFLPLGCTPKNGSIWTYYSGAPIWLNEINACFASSGAAFWTLASSAWMESICSESSKNNILVNITFHGSFKRAISLTLENHNPIDLLGTNAICEGTEPLMSRLNIASSITTITSFNQTSLRL